MTSNSWNQTLITAQSDGSSLAGTSAGSLLPAAAKFTMPATLLKIGDRLRIKAGGRITTGATPGTWTPTVRFGSTDVFAPGASGTLVASQTNLTWRMEIELTVRAIGASATVIGTGQITSAIISATTPILLLPTSAPAVGSTFDSTASFVVDLYSTFSNAGTSATLHEYELALLT